MSGYPWKQRIRSAPKQKMAAMVPRPKQTAAQNQKTFQQRRTPQRSRSQQMCRSHTSSFLKMRTALPIRRPQPLRMSRQKPISFPGMPCSDPESAFREAAGLYPTVLFSEAALSAAVLCLAELSVPSGCSTGFPTGFLCNGFPIQAQTSCIHCTSFFPAFFRNPPA